MDNNRYVYTPLSPVTSQIRLLKIKNIGQAEIQCSLHTYDLDEIEYKYSTLSYVWGTQGFTSTIVCDGGKLMITPSLEGTLKELFKYEAARFERAEKKRLGIVDKDDGDGEWEDVDENEQEVDDKIGNDGFDDDEQIEPSQCLFWIDAICLNQQDRDEVFAQVPMMGRIYSSSRKTFAYLGSAAKGSDLAMMQLPFLEKQLTLLRPPGTFHQLELLGYGRQHSIWRDFAQICKRYWFERVWTLQEGLLSQKLILGCGSHWISSDVFLRIFMSLIRCGLLEILDRSMAISKYSQTGEFSNYKPLENVYFSLAARQVMIVQLKERGHSLDILDLSRKRTCKFPADHIWGALGLMHPEEVKSFLNFYGIATSKAPQTAASHLDTYIDFFSWCIEESNDVNILSYAPSEKRPADLPSWCPNWDSRPSYINHLCSGQYATGISSKGVHPPASIPFMKVHRHSKHLEISGFRIDKVDQLVPTDTIGHVHEKDFSKTDSRVAEWERRCQSLARYVYRGREGFLLDAYSRTLIGDTIDGGSSSLPFQAENSSKTSAATLGNPRYEKVEPLNLPEKTCYLRAVVRTYINRSFMSTTGGRIGWVPADAQPGDTICVFYGGGPLYVIRFEPGKKEATFIGEAYAHGLMWEGEALGSPDRGPDEKFVLI